MILYHGTSRAFLKRIQAEGVNSPSYWGAREQAQAYASTFGKDGVVLVADIDPEDLKASLYMAQELYDAGDLDELPDEDDLKFSLEYLGGVTCHRPVHDFRIEKNAPDPEGSLGAGL